MDPETQLAGNLAIFNSGTGEWIEEAEKHGIDDEAIWNMKEANQHATKALEIVKENYDEDDRE
jgi:hypothetical protein